MPILIVLGSVSGGTWQWSTPERSDVPGPGTRLNRRLPLVKWLLVIPNYLVLFFLDIAAVIILIIVWFAILFTGRYPSGLFGFVEG